MNLVQLFKRSSVALLLAGSLASAQDISYDFAELRYLDSEIGNQDGDGIEVAGSYQFDPEWLVTGSYSAQDFGSSFDVDILEIGVGYILPQTNGFDLVGAASIVNADYGDDDDNGFRLALQARSNFTEQLEGRASLNYLDVNDSDLFIELGADYFFSPQLSAGAEIQLGSDTDTISIGARWYYNR